MGRDAVTARRAAARAAEAAARVVKAASDRVRREAARRAGGGGIPASGGGGGGIEALDSAMNLDDEIAAVSAVDSSLLRSSSHISDVAVRRRAASANRSARKAAAVLRGAPRADLDPNYRGHLRFSRPPNAHVGPSPVVHTGLSVNSSLPSSTPSYSGILAALARWIKYRFLHPQPLSPLSQTPTSRPSRPSRPPP